MRVVNRGSASRFIENKTVLSQFTKNKIDISRFTKKNGVFSTRTYISACTLRPDK